MFVKLTEEFDEKLSEYLGKMYCLSAEQVTEVMANFRSFAQQIKITFHI